MEINKIYNENCLETMARMPDGFVDLIVTDPPYENDTHGGGQSNMAQRQLNKGHIDFISNGFDFAVFDECCRIAKRVNFVVFCSNKQISKMMSYFETKSVSVTLLVWQKTNPVPFGNGKFVSNTEYIVWARGKGCPFNAKNTGKIFTYPTMGASRIHPTQKPDALIEDLVRICSNENDLIYDPFGGSMTTAKAAHQLKRRWIMSEISQEYCDLGAKRLEPYLAQESLF